MSLLKKTTGRYFPWHKALTKRWFRCPVKPLNEEISLTNCKSFDSIPGPKSFPFIGTLWKYLPVLGEYKFDRLRENGLLKLQQYGQLVREDIVPGVSVVWVYTPEDIETVYRCEGRYPERRSHLALQKYRQDRPHIYKTGGLLPTLACSLVPVSAPAPCSPHPSECKFTLWNGEEWWRLRSGFQKSLSRVQDVRSHLPATDEIMQEFIQFATASHHTRDFLPKLSRLYLELTCTVAFSARMDSFSVAEQASDSRSSQLISAAATTNSCILGTDNGPQLWRRWRTPLYRKLERALNTLEAAAVELVTKLQAEGVEDSPSLVAQYLSCPDSDIRDIYGMAVDLILAGIDTTTYTSCFALYHLATNLVSQQQVYKEACELLPRTSDNMLADTLAHASVTRAVVKETLRMNPVSVGVGRILAKDAVLSGYHVPSGTVVVTQNQVTCRLPEYFPRPDKFLPERWVKGSPEHRVCSPYLVLPFGHGPRSCIARRLAEQALQVLIIRLVREYEVSWCGGELGVRSLLINKPDQPVLLRLNKRRASSS